MDELISSHLEVLDASPADGPAFAALEEAFTAESRWQELVRLYEKRIPHVEEEAPALMLRAARILEDRVGDAVGAERWLRRAVEAEPDAAEARERLRRIHLSRGDELGLCELFERDAARASTPEAAADAYFTLGDSLEVLGKRPRAIEMWQRALRLVPTHRQALARSREAYVALGRFEAAQAVVDREVVAQPGELAAHAVRYAELGRLALEQPYRHALARSCAEAALALDEGCLQARLLLAAIDALASGWRDQVRSLKARAGEERDRKVAARLHLQAAGLHAAYDDQPDVEERVQDALRKAFLLWPAMPEALEFLERRHAEREDFSGLAQAWQALVAVTSDRESQVELHLRLANLWSIRFDDRPRTMDALAQAARLDPSRAEAVLPLVELLQDEGRDQEVIGLLEAFLAASPAAARRLELRLLLGELYLPLDAATARQHLETALELDPACDRAAELLEAVVTEPSALAILLERRVERASDPVEGISLLQRIAELQPAAATRALARALALDPARVEIREALRSSGGDREAALAAFRAAADAAADPSVRKELLAAAAETSDRDLGRPAEAAQLWKRVVALAPADARAASELERLLAGSGQVDTLIQGYRLRLADATEPDERRVLLEKLAGLPLDGAEAVAIHRELVTLLPGDEGLLRRLAALLGEQERWDEELEILSRLADSGSIAARAERASLLVDRLGRTAEGAADFLAVFAAAPDHAGVAAALQRLLRGGVEVERIAGALAPHYARTGDWASWAELAEARIAAAPDAATRRSLLLELASVHEDRLADPRAAFDAVARAFVEAPDAGESLQRLERLAEELHSLPELAATLREAWESAEPAEALAIARRVVSLAEGPLADERLALAGWQRILDLDPTSDDALAALSESAAAAGRWAEATVLLERRLAVAPAELQPELERMRAAWLTQQGAFGHAVEALRASLAAGGDEDELLPALAEALAGAGRQQELVEVVARLAARADEKGDVVTAASRLLEEARLHEALQRNDIAVDRYTAVLSRLPREREAIESLELRLDDPATAVAAARALAPVYEAAGEAQKLYRTLELQVDAATEPRGRAALLRRMSGISLRQLRAPGLAFGALARALRDAPFDESLRAELREAAEAAVKIPELARLLAEVAEGLPGEEAVALERELASLLEERLGDRAGAAARHERILATLPGDAGALQALHRLLSATEGWGRLHEVCLALAAIAEDAAEKQRLWREAGELALERLADPTRAAAALRPLAEAGDAAALRHLDIVYTDLGQWSDLAWVLERDPGPEAVSRLAGICRGALGDPSRALALYGGIAATHEPARLALEAWASESAALSSDALGLVDPLLAAAGDHDRRVELREARLAAGIAGEERLRLHEEIVSIHEDDRGQPERAFMAACRAFAEGADVGDRLERLARETGSFEELVTVYEEVAAAREGSEADALRRKAAGIRESELGDVTGAIEHWSALLASSPADPQILEALAGLYARAARFGELVEIHRRRAELAVEVDERCSRLVEAAAICADKLHDGERAAAIYREVLALDDLHFGAMEALAELLEPGEELIDILGNLAAFAAEGSAERTDALVRQAALVEATGDKAAALELRRKLLVEVPGEPRTVAALEACLDDADVALAAGELLEPLYRERGDGDRLVRILRDRLGRGGPNRAIFAELASIHESRGELDAAFSATIALLGEDPSDAEVQRRLVALATETGGFFAVAAAVEQVLGERGDDAALLALVAPIYETRLGRLADAVEAWERIRALDAGDGAALESLHRLHRENRSWDRLVEICLALGSIAEAAAVAENELGDPERALAIWRRLGDDPAALAEVERLAESIGDAGELASALEQRLAADPADMVLRCKLARVRRSLGDVDGALALLDAEPFAPEVQELLGAWARSDEAGARQAFDILDTALAAADAHAARIDLREARLAFADRLERLAEIRRIHEEDLSQPELAFTAACRAFAAGADVKADLERLARATSAFEELADLYEAADDPELLPRIAAIREFELQDRDGAVDAWSQRLEHRPENLEALDALIRLLDGDRRQAELLVRRASLSDERIPWLLRAAGAADAERARALYNEILSIDTSHRAALEALVALLGEDPAALADVHGRLAELEEAPGEQAKHLLARALLLEELGRNAEALELCASVLAAVPGSPETIALLERLRLEDETAALAASTLEPIYRSANDLPGLIRVLETLLRGATGWERTGLLVELSSLRETAGEKAAAFSALVEAFASTPDDPAARERLVRLAHETGSFEELASVVEGILAGKSATDVTALPLLAILAPIYERELRRPQAAASAWERMRIAAPEDRDSLRALQRLYREAGAWEHLHEICLALGETEHLREAALLAEEKLADPAAAAASWRRIAEADPADRAALEKLLALAASDADRAWALELLRRLATGAEARALACSLAELHRSLGDAGAALGLYLEVLAEDRTDDIACNALDRWARSDEPQAFDAFELLDGALAEAGAHARRIELREARLRAGVSAAERIARHDEIRRIHEELGQPDLAFMATCRAFAEGLDVGVHLERLARETGSFEELVEIYDDAADAAADPAFRRRAAILTEVELGDPAGAIERWRAILDEIPSDPEALDALCRLLRSAGKGDELLELLRRRAVSGERQRWLREIANTCNGMGDRGGAVEAWRELAAEGSREALAALESLLDPERDREELAGIRLRLADGSGDEERIGWLVRRASLLSGGDALEAWAGLLGERPGHPAAIAGLEQLLGDDSVAREAAALLEPIYRQRGRDEGSAGWLARILDLRLVGATGAEREALLGELAMIRESLGEIDAAFVAALAHFAASPDDASVRETLVRLADATGGHEELAGAIEDALGEKDPDGADALPLWSLLAPLYAGRLDRPAAAAEAWERLAVASPQDPEPLDHLEALYRALGEIHPLTTVFHRKALLDVNAERRKDLLFEMANLLEDRLGDRDAAVEAYRRILAIDDRDPEALTMLSRLLGETQRWDELAGLLEGQVQNAAARDLPDEARELRFRLARIRRERLGDAAGAITLFRSVLAEQPRHPETLAALEELVQGPAADERALAAEILAPIYAEERDWARQARMLDLLAGAATDAAEKAALHRGVAELYEGPLASPELAFLAAGRALRIVPDDESSLELVLRTASAGEDLADELDALLDECAEQAATDAGRLSLLRARAEMLDAAGDAGSARAAWQRVRALAPDDGSALRSLARLSALAGDADACLESLRALEAREEDPQARRALLLEIATVQEERQRDLGGALSTLRRILDLDPLDADALLRMDQLCVRQERWTDLADVLAREEQAARGRGDLAGRVEFLYRLAHLRETELLDRDGALALYREILAIQPDHAETVSRLEAYLAADPDDLDVIASLEAVARSTGDWLRLASMLESRAAATPDHEARKAVLVDLAGIREERLGLPDLAFLTLARAFREDPTDASLWQHLWRTAEAADAADEWLALLEEELPRIADPRTLATLALQAARICDATLHDEDAAIRWFETARGADAELGAPALVALERLYREKERWAELAGVLEPLADREEDPREKVGLLFRLARLAEERLSDGEKARAAYERILELDPKHLPSLRALEHLYEGAQSSDSLYVNLLAQRDSTPEGSSWMRISARLAEVAAERDDEEAAIGHWRELLTRNPRHEGAHKGLESLYERAGRYTELAQLLRGRLQVTVDPREIVHLHERLGGILAKNLGAADEALRSYQAVLERDPRSRSALEALRGIHAQRGDHAALATVLRRLVPLQESPAGVKSVRLQLATTLAALGRREEAIESAKRVLDLEPHELDSLVQAEELLREFGAWPEVVRTLELQAPLLDAADAARAADLWRDVARIWEERLHRREGAAAALEKVLEHRLDPEAFERLREIYRSVADWRRYALITERFATDTQDPSAKVALFRELATILEERLGQRQIAFGKLGAAVELAPADRELRAHLRRLADLDGMHEELAMIFESVADSLEPGDTAAEILLELGRLQDEVLDEGDDAEATYRKILAFAPTHADALASLAGLFGKRGEDSSLVLVLEQKLEASRDPDEQRSILHQIAKVFDEKLSDTEQAIAALCRAQELDPGAPDTREALGALYRRENRFHELAALLTRARDLSDSFSERLSLQVRLAEVRERELGDVPGAILAWRTALEIEPGSAKALDALERLCADQPEELLGIYERKLTLATDPALRATLQRQCARIWAGSFEDAGRAISCLEAALADVPEDEEALAALEHLLRTEGRWERLAETLERHERLPGLSSDERVELLTMLGSVLHGELGRIDAAEAAYHRALSHDPDAAEALAALSRIYEVRADWRHALEMLRREAEIAGSTPQAVELWHRIGTILDGQVGDPDGAESSWRRALAVDPGFAPALQGLRGLYRARGDWNGILGTLADEAAHTADAGARAELFDEAGEIELEQRGDPEAAIRFFEAAREAVPGDLEASRILAPLYVERQRWSEAESVLDVICAFATGEELSGASYRLGAVCEQQSKIEKALSAYGRAYELDPTLLMAAEGMGRLLVANGQHARALQVYQGILVSHRDELSDPEVVEVHYAMGDLRRRLREDDAARKAFRAALEIDPWHVESRRAMSAMAEAVGDWAGALEHRQKLLQALDGEERHLLLVDTARLAAANLRDPYQAIDLYAAALRKKPDDVTSMEALLELYRQTGQGSKAIELIEQLLQLPAVQADRERATRFHLHLGELYRGEIETDPAAREKAVAHLDAALDLDWRQTQAFQILEGILGAAGDWRGLEANYVRMLQRLPKEEATRGARVLLFRTLGDLYLNALQDPAAASEAYKAVTVLAPDDPAAAVAHAELATRRQGAEAEAIDAWRKALPLVTENERPAKELVKLHAKLRRYDEAFVAAQVVTDVLGKQGPDELGILEKLKRFSRESAAGKLSDALWTGRLYHEGVKNPVGEMLTLVYRHAGEHFALDGERFSLQGKEIRIDRKRDRVDLASSMLFFVNAYKYAAQALGMPALELYQAAGLSGLAVVNTWPTILLAGEDIFGDARKKELYFQIARALAFSRPELAMARLHGQGELEVLLQAAVSLGEPRFKVSADPRVLEKIRKKLEKALPGDAGRSLQKLAYGYARDRQRPTLRSYVEGAELTAIRAGTLLATDLQVAHRAALADVPGAARVTAQARAKDLVAFCLSSDYAELRQALGLAVQIG